jgi:Peptidase family M28
MRHSFHLILFTILYVSSNAQLETLNKLCDNVSERSLKLNLYKIASNEFEGRMAATKGDNLAINFIANWFNANHLTKPYKTTTPFLQEVPLTHYNYSASSFSVDWKLFELDKQWTYANGSNNVESSSAEVVFIGYGISVPSFDELRDVNIEGKYVILQFGFPVNKNSINLISEKEMPTERQQIMSILKGKPLGVLIYTSDFRGDMNQINYSRLSQPYHIYQKEEMAPFDVNIISSDIANYLVGNIDSIYNIINNSGKPRSFNTGKKITVSIHKEEQKTSTKNIVGILKGTDEKLPCIVFTAHHDHEGKINGTTYYGADDNGSGTTALLEIIKVLGDAANKGIRPKRTIVFVSTSAEEQGLYGSEYYVEHPVIPFSKTYCNINIDMLGRVDSFYSAKKADSNYVYCMYYDTTNIIFNFKKLQSINHSYGRLIIDTLYGNKGKTLNPHGLMARSDNFPFMKRGVPSLWFFSGYHKDYHQTSDTPDKLNFPLFKRRTQFALATLWQLASK